MTAMVSRRRLAPRWRPTPAGLRPTTRSAAIAAERQVSWALYVTAMAGLVVLAALVRFYQLGAASVWLDEGISLWAARLPWSRLLPELATHDESPPLYFALLHLWLVFGDAETWIRLLSVLPSLATVVLGGLLGQRLGGRAAGLLAALFLAVSPEQVRYAQEARMYALVTALTLGATLAALRVLEVHGPGAWRWSVLCGVGIAALAATHYTAAPVGAALLLGLGLVALARRSMDLAGRTGLAALVAGVLWAPVAPIFLAQSRLVSEHYWIPPITLASTQRVLLEASLAWPPPLSQIHVDDPLTLHRWQDLVLALISLPRMAPWATLSRFLAGAQPWLLPCLAGVLLLGLWQAQARSGNGATLLLGLATLGPVAALIAVSLSRPLLLDRSLLSSGTLALVLAASAVTALPGLWRLLLLVPLLTLQLLGLGQQWWYPGLEQWREVAAQLATQARPHELVLIHNRWTQLPLDYALEHTAHSPLTEQGVPGSFEEIGKPTDITADDLARVRQQVAGQERVWLVLSHTFDLDPQNKVRQALEHELPCFEVWPRQGVTLVLFTRCMP